ncbi:hypothetical protein NG796_02765 [Laspinema sp. A4]|uniref:hypothetical protein n=1 Tax=Laspinema sp. D2d TaxID=2953686 RepID=UPI0021BB10F8|nr:hypothetical protein [Laspinema sp. D2d]MCT7982209.1 hypothetical protein [Laspinema sp. D2d]
MAMPNLHRFLTGPLEKSPKSTVIFWLTLTLVFATFYGSLVLQHAFSIDYVVQDDARQHVFWMQRFIDPELFPNDWIADYFQSVAPAGYTAFYWIIAKLGVSPMLLHKLLPPILGLITTVFCFGITMELLPVPVAGFISGLLVNHYIWMRDDVVSATPVAFVYPLFTGFVYYLLRNNLVGTGVFVALLGLFYPQCLLVAIVVLILQVLRLTDWRPHRKQPGKLYQFYGSLFGIAAIVIIAYMLKSDDYGPVITAAEAKTLPEFLKRGKSEFFSEDWGHYWFTGQRSGMMPRFGIISPLILGGILPLLLRFRGAFPLAGQIKQAGILLEIMLASLGMFFLSHLMLFELHLPSRYTEHTFRIVSAIAAGITVTLVMDALLILGENINQKTITRVGCYVILAALILEPLGLKRFPRTDYQYGYFPALYEFFAQQPKDIQIASVTDEVNNIPSFSQRSILIGNEGYVVPYHEGYYAEIQERSLDLIHAHYSPELTEVKQFITDYDIDFWLIEEGSFTASYVKTDRWMMQYQPAANQAIAQMEKGMTPVLAQVGDRCTVFHFNKLAVLDSACILTFNSSDL